MRAHAWIPNPDVTSYSQPRGRMEQTRKKRRKYSKRSKKNLRKYTDIRDVEEFLEEQRLQERTGGLVAEKKDEELFFVEHEAADEAQRTLKSQRRKKPLRSHSNLLPDPVVSSSRQTDAHSRSESGGGEGGVKRLLARLGEVSDSSEDEREYDVGSRFSVRRQQEERQLARAVCERVNKSRLQQPVARDLWADDVNAVSCKDVPDEHFLRVTCKLAVKKPVSVGERPSALASVPPPPPGSSYNPAFDDHQELLRNAVDAEEARLSADQRINKKLEAMEPMTAVEREQVWQDEMVEGLLEEEDDGEKEEETRGEEEEEEECLPVHRRPVVARDRKTLQRRRRETERKMKEKQRLAVKTMNKRMNDVYRLRSLKKMIEGKEVAVSEKKRERQKAMQEEILHTKRLGRLPYMDPDIDVQLSSEISGALRSLKCEGSIARDRYKGLQRRNIIEPRQRVRPHRKYKLKYKEKRSAKLPEEIGTIK